MIRVMLDARAFMPEQAHEADAGYDLRSPEHVHIPSRGSAVIDTGVHVALPMGIYGRVASRSGLNMKHDLTCEGVIDSGYTGSIRVKLYNHGYTDYDIRIGDRIAQLIFEMHASPDLVRVDALEDTERGDGGFGSTGR